LAAEKFHKFPPASSRKPRRRLIWNDKGGTPADGTNAAHCNKPNLGKSCRQLSDQIIPVASRRKGGVKCFFLALSGHRNAKAAITDTGLLSIREIIERYE
jgi:hypothetical protein